MVPEHGRMTARPPFADRLRKAEWTVRPVRLAVCQAFIAEHHYAGGGANTATYSHGLFRVDDPATCRGIAWWFPPTRDAAHATYPEDWHAVLSLSRLALAPDVPKNGCSFLLARSIKLIDRDRWPCLVTYADEWKGHLGTIYRAAGWQYLGLTKPEPTFVRNGVMISRKRGHRTFTRAEMIEQGAELIGSFARHKFVSVVAGRPAARRRQSELNL